MKKIARIILSSESNLKKVRKDYTIIFSPRRTITCKEALENEGIYASCNLKDLNFDLIPLEKDLLSLEMNDCFKRMFVDSDLTTFNYVVESIERLELVYGRIPHIFSIGNGAQIVYDNLNYRH